MTWAILKKFDIFFSKTKPRTLGIIYRPANSEWKFCAKLDTYKKELYILGDFNINLYQKENYAGCKSNTLVLKKVSNDIKNYHQCCAMSGLTQKTKSPTRITYSSTSLINHILGSAPTRISQVGVKSVGLSNHQLNYCTLVKLVELKLEVCTKILHSIHLRITRLMVIKMLWGK